MIQKLPKEIQLQIPYMLQERLYYGSTSDSTKKEKRKQQKRKQYTNNDIPSCCRTIEECYIQLQNIHSEYCLIHQNPFAKNESEQLIQSVQQHNQNAKRRKLTNHNNHDNDTTLYSNDDDDDDNNTNDTNHINRPKNEDNPTIACIDWEEMANMLNNNNNNNTHHGKETKDLLSVSNNNNNKTNHNNNKKRKKKNTVVEEDELGDHHDDEYMIIKNRKRSAWDCFIEYQQQLKQQKIVVQQQQKQMIHHWTRSEDELLFKYLLLAGPSFILDQKHLCSYNLLTDLLPTKNKIQIYHRCNNTLLNPQWIYQNWNEMDERLLPIYMKLYYHVPKKPSGDLFLTSTHYHQRSTKSVVDKWNRTINPQYENTPFTKKEDALLLTMIRKGSNNSKKKNHPTGTGISWSYLSQYYLPNRHPHRLSNRFYEIATDQDILLQHHTSSSSTSNGGGGGFGV